MDGLKYHEVANIFPLMQGEEYEALKQDIAANGLREAIWLHPDGSIIDGRNRYRACVDTGIEPVFRTWDGDNLIAFVVSLNLHRRHLNESQRAMVAAKIATMTEGRPDKTRSIDLVSQEQAAHLLNVSVPSIKRAKTVQEQGTADLLSLVESGEVAVSTAAEVATLPAKEQQEVIAKGEKEILAKAKEIRQKKTAKRRKERVDKINTISQGNTGLTEAITKVYPVLYIDPPWQYGHSESDNRKIENHYPTMPLQAICDLKVGEIAAPDSILFLWATSPKLAEAIEVLKAWGFNYRSCLVWDKERIGMGYYARQQHELLLVATRGQIPTPLPENRPASVVRLRRDNEHSVKPSEFYDLIERMYPEFDRIELFARQQRNGWARWGNQA